ALALIPAAAALEGCAGGKSLPMANGAVLVPKSMLDAQGTVVVKAKGMGGKLLVARRADGGYSALGLTCPHKGGSVSDKGGVLTCAWHGSTFDKEGRVTNGPAKTGLTKYAVEEAGEDLRVLVG